MKRTILIFLSIIAGIAMSMPARGADKVLERSDKHRPEWLSSHSTGQILVEVERPNLNEAMKEAELELSRRIISAVAVNISHSNKSTATDEWADNTNRYFESFTSTTETSSAKLPFLKEVSLSKAHGTYWEKREEKGTKRHYVVYSVCYPLSDRELAEMTREFEKTDKEKSDELRKLRSELTDVDSSDKIQDALGRLSALEEYFFDGVRIKETRGLAASYRELYNGLTLDGEVNEEVHRMTCRVMLNGKPFKATAMPQLSSNCASQLSATHSTDGNYFIVSYSDEDCLANEENWIEVTLRMKGKRLNKKFYFKKNDQK